MKSAHYRRPPHDHRIHVSLPEDLKRKVFALAQARNVPASALIRQALVNITSKAA